VTGKELVTIFIQDPVMTGCIGYFIVWCIFSI